MAEQTTTVSASDDPPDTSCSECGICGRSIESREDSGIEGANGCGCRRCLENLHTVTFGVHLVVDKHRFLVGISPSKTNAVSFGSSLVTLDSVAFAALSETEERIVRALADWDWPADFEAIDRRPLDDDKCEAVAPELQTRDCSLDKTLAHQLPKPIVFSHSNIHVPGEAVSTVEDILEEEAAAAESTSQGSLADF